MNGQNPATQEPVIIVGAGPAGCTAALLLADSGIPVTLLERYPQPHPLPRAVHLDDEVARILARIGVAEGFLARSRPGSGLRLLDAGHRVMAEFRREHQASEHGFPQANMVHQPDLEELLFARVKAHRWSTCAAAPRRRAGGLLPPARPGPGADQQLTRRRNTRPARRGPRRRLDRRPSRRRPAARRPAGPGGPGVQPGADPRRAPGPRGRGGGAPAPAAAPVLDCPGHGRPRVSGHG